MILADLYIHSTFSDGKMNIPEIVDLYGSLGFGAIGITDFLCETKNFTGKTSIYFGRTLTTATFPLYKEILKSEAERAWKQYKMLLIPGIEFKKKSISKKSSASLIGLGVVDYISADNNILTLTRNIHERGGITIAAKPLMARMLWEKREELGNEIDAWDVTSGKSNLDEIILQSNLPKIAGSALRTEQQISSWKTVLYCEKNQEAVFDAIRKQNLSFKFFNGGNDGRSHHFSHVHAMDFCPFPRHTWNNSFV